MALERELTRGKNPILALTRFMFEKSHFLIAGITRTFQVIAVFRLCFALSLSKFTGSDFQHPVLTLWLTLERDSL